MKFLLDQNLSSRVVQAIEDLFPGSTHVRDVGLDRSDDDDVWDFARDGGFVLVSKDADFQQRALVHGHPPKVVFLGVGNCPTGRVIGILRDRAADLALFERDAAAALLILR